MLQQSSIVLWATSLWYGSFAAKVVDKIEFYVDKIEELLYSVIDMLLMLHKQFSMQNKNERQTINATELSEQQLSKAVNIDEKAQ